MQSQQKRVKWSRGETAEALEERADTGITQASVELMENCIPDIYGNISRRPALKPIPYNVVTYFADYSNFGFSTVRLLDIIPFYISENDYILIGIHDLAPAEFIRITNDVCVYKYVFGSFNQGDILGNMGKINSFAQQNNYLLIAGSAKVVKITLSSLDNGSPYKFVPSVETWEYSAGWYAPNGTQTKVVSDSIVTTLNISGQFTNYTYTEPSGLTAVYSYTNTNVPANSIETLKSEIPVGSIVQLPKIGAYFRVEGYTFGSSDTTNVAFIDDTFDGVLGPNDAVPSTGKYCKAVNSIKAKGILRKYVNGVQTEQIDVAGGKTQVVKNSSSLTGYSSGYFSIGGGITKPTTWQGWSAADVSSLKVAMFGELLTPVADSSQTDSSVDVEYGFVSLQPNSFEAGYNGVRVIYPHPEQLCFCDQRLWVANWQIGLSVNSEKYPVVIGSQVARYNDFKNNYNDENEPITLDVLTNFKEKILHLVDYNGLKIMTDCYEYAYEDGGIIKQSGNGSWEECEPLVFDSLCLYVDSTGHQIKAMQYEFQSNIFNSSTINQLAPHDLIWEPIGMGLYEDKIHSTGKYLFVVNKDGASAKLAVCNFVPSNQANIWSRWTFPISDYNSMLYNIVRLKDKTLFMVFAKNVINNQTVRTVIIPTVLDFDGNADFEANVDNNYYTIASYNTERLTLSDTTVNIYSGGVFQFTATSSPNGWITTDVSQLTNVTVGLPINSTIRSHPIDVGGKTKSIKKRIAKARMSVRDTNPGALTINGKTGYMNPAEDYISFYGVTGMKQEIKYTITNNNGAMFHLESLLMNIEYGTLIS